MESRKQQDVSRNDALAVLTEMVGTSDEWDEDVAAAKAAAVIAEEAYALCERHGLMERRAGPAR